MKKTTTATKTNSPASNLTFNIAPPVKSSINSVVQSDTETVEKDYSENYNFKVITEPLKTSRGITPLIAIINDENGNYLGSHKNKDGNIITNEMLVKQIQNALAKRGLKYDFSPRCTADGARFFGEFVLPSLSFKSPEGEKVEAKILVENSYNGTLAQQMVIAFMHRSRAFCLPKAIPMDGISEISIEPAQFAEILSAEREIYANLAKVPMSAPKGQLLLENICKSNRPVFAEKTENALKMNWLTQERGELNLFSVFKGVTKFFFDVSEAKYELARRMTNTFSDKISEVIQRPNTLQALLAH